MHFIIVRHQAHPEDYPFFVSGPHSEEVADFWADAMQNTLDIDFEVWSGELNVDLRSCPNCKAIQSLDEGPFIPPHYLKRDPKLTWNHVQTAKPECAK